MEITEPPVPGSYLFTNPGEIVDLGDDLLFWSTIDVEVYRSTDVVALRLVIEEGRPAVEQILAVRRPDGPPLSGQTMNGLEQLIQDAIGKTASMAWFKVHAPDLPEGPNENDTPIRNRQRAASLRRHRGASDDDLREVARVYVANRLDAPTEAVADDFDVSKRTATRWVALAREAGYLPPYRQED